MLDERPDLGSHLQFNDFDLVSHDWWLCALVQSGVQHLYGIVVELVREIRPVESE